MSVRGFPHGISIWVGELGKLQPPLSPQLSADGWAVLPPCWLIGLRWPSPKSTGSTVGLKATSKRAYANGRLPGLLLPAPPSPKQDTACPHLQIVNGTTDAEAEASILWPPDVKSWLIGKDPGAERLKAGEEGDKRGWNGWMTSPTQWTWVWANSGR